MENKIDVVYLLGTGSQWHNLEIRYSLRSLEKHLYNYGKIWVVGERHPHLEGVNFIPYPDKTSVSDTNIMHKLTRACEESAITDEFLFFNDDHYLLDDFDAATFPYFRNQNLEDHPRYMRAEDSYGRRVKNTYEYLKGKGLPTRHFDIHTPIRFKKEKFLEHVTNGPDWSQPTQSYVIKSIYANTERIIGEPMKDHKTKTPPSSRARIYSTAPRVRACVARFLQEQFPHKSNFEITDL